MIKDRNNIIYTDPDGWEYEVYYTVVRDKEPHGEYTIEIDVYDVEAHEDAPDWNTSRVYDYCYEWERKYG